MRLLWGIVAIAAVLGANFANALQYNYSDTSSWPGECSANPSQSPINITNAQYSSSAALVANWPTSGATATAANSQQTIVITMDSPSSTTLQTIPTLDEQTHYYLQQVEFHWGNDNTSGSPHAIDGEFFPLEVQFTFYSSEAGSFSAASTAAGGLVTYSILYNISDTGSDTLTTILSFLNASTFYDGTASVALSAVNYTSLFPDNYREDFYYYKGSKQYPDCTENVMWIIAKDLKPVSLAQLTTLRSFNISSSGPSLGPNYRALQKTDDRIIRKTFVETVDEPGPTGNSFILALFFIFGSLICVAVAVTTAALKSKQYHVIDEVHN